MEKPRALGATLAEGQRHVTKSVLAIEMKIDKCVQYAIQVYSCVDMVYTCMRRHMYCVCGLKLVSFPFVKIALPFKQVNVYSVDSILFEECMYS